MDSTAKLYTTPQRYTALVYGIVSLTLFVSSVSVMCWSLYNGLHGSLLHLHGGAALAMDVLLILQFAIGHTIDLDGGRSRVDVAGAARDGEA